MKFERSSKNEENAYSNFVAHTQTIAWPRSTIQIHHFRWIAVCFPFPISHDFSGGKSANPRTNERRPYASSRSASCRFRAVFTSESRWRIALHFPFGCSFTPLTHCLSVWSTSNKHWHNSSVTRKDGTEPNGKSRNSSKPWRTQEEIEEWIVEFVSFYRMRRLVFTSLPTLHTLTDLNGKTNAHAEWIWWMCPMRRRMAIKNIKIVLNNIVAYCCLLPRRPRLNSIIIIAIVPHFTALWVHAFDVPLWSAATGQRNLFQNNLW